MEEMERKTSFTLHEVDDIIQMAIDQGWVREPKPLTEKEREHAINFVKAVEHGFPELKEIFDADPDGCHFCRSVDFMPDKRKRYMIYAQKRKSILR